MSPIILYGLQGKAGGDRPNFSPHPWKIKVDLEYLGLPYEEVNLSFAEIRGDLAKKTGNDKVTVPTIIDDGEIITDSWKIALHLEEKYAKPAGKSLFLGTAEGRNFAHFIHIWAVSGFTPIVRPLVMPFVRKQLDSPSHEYFVNSKFGGSCETLDNWLALCEDSESLQTACQSGVQGLGVLEGHLQYNHENHLAQDGGLWLGGAGFSHADAIAFGLYCWHRLNSDVKEKVWESDKLPFLGIWLKGMLERFTTSNARLY